MNRSQPCFVICNLISRLLVFQVVLFMTFKLQLSELNFSVPLFGAFSCGFYLSSKYVAAYLHILLAPSVSSDRLERPSFSCN